MHTYIDSFKKERAEYPEQNTAYFQNVENITVDSDNVILQEKQKVCEEETHDKNEANNSMNARKTIDASKTIEQNLIKTIKVEAAEEFITCLNTCLENLL